MTTSEPTTGEIVRALGNPETLDQESLYYWSKFAADRLESQEAQIKQLSEALAYANEWHKESVENATNELRELSGIAGELERFRAFHERYAEQTSKKYVEEICALTARAESAEAERDAAIADMKIMALAMRESDELQEGCCFACKYDSQNLPDNVMLAYGECPGYDADDCFEWRGLQPQDGEGV